jgi:hypothetical protein
MRLRAQVRSCVVVMRRAASRRSYRMSRSRSRMINWRTHLNERNWATWLKSGPVFRTDLGGYSR